MAIFKVFNKKKHKTKTEDQPKQQREDAQTPSRQHWGQRLKGGLSKTRQALTGSLKTLFTGKTDISDELLEELETILLMADVGVEATTEIIDDLTDKWHRKQLQTPEKLEQALHQLLQAKLEPVAKPLSIDPKQKPYVILVVGVNGSGKTTTIGKLANHYHSQGHSVMLAAGDTFRAAAVEQLKTWGERIGVPVISQPTGSDSASVIYDALQSAMSRQTDVLIADTAGRLHTQSNLMAELKKVIRVMQKLKADAPHETLLVLDASMGQNALMQAQKFHSEVDVSGLALTKLDGTAKGGIIFAIAHRLNLPVRFIGIGEQTEDLRPFEAQSFVEALLTEQGEKQ